MQDFSALSAAQRRAAQILAVDDDRKWTMEQIADECNVTVRTIYNWKQDETFIAYKNMLAEKAMDDFLAEAYQMLKDIGRTGSEKNRLKALELAMKNRGKLTERQIVEATVEDKRTNDAIEAEIDRLRQELGE